MIHVAVAPQRTVVRWARARYTAYLVVPEALVRKDFSTLPVCGSVRPSASQRTLARGV